MPKYTVCSFGESGRRCLVEAITQIVYIVEYVLTCSIRFYYYGQWRVSNCSTMKQGMDTGTTKYKIRKHT